MIWRTISFIILLVIFLVSLSLVLKLQSKEIYTCEKIKELYGKSYDKEFVIEVNLTKDCKINNIVIPKGYRIIKIKNAKIEYI